MSDNEPAAHPRVLIVDDSRMVRASITRLIRDAYEVREEGDGEAGWQTLLLDPTLQVVISDLSMPKLDGYGLLERIRASKISRIQSIPVIMISGDEDDAARAKAKDLGATDFITKGIGKQTVYDATKKPTDLVSLASSQAGSQILHAFQQPQHAWLIDFLLDPARNPVDVNEGV